MAENPPKIGDLITGKAYRDAIHIAVAPVIAAEHLSPGEHVGFVHNSTAAEVEHSSENPVGIVDPFLLDPVEPGEQFYLFLYPNTITSLRHEWTHPSFKEEQKDSELSTETVAASELWLHNFAAQFAELSYSHLLQAAQNFLDYDDYMIDGGKWEGFSVPEEFWDHFENVTDQQVPAGKRHSFFSCSC